MLDMDEKDFDFDELYSTQKNYYSQPSDGLIKCVNNYVPFPCTALDVGCGQGRNALWLASQGFKVLAIDNSSSAIKSLKKIAYEKRLDIDAQLSDILSFNLRQKEFGLILIQTTLNHLDPDCIIECCTKIYQSLKCDGILYCVAFTTDDPGFKGQNEIASECTHLIKHYFSPGELRKLFSKLKILYYKEYIKVDDSHGPKHFHGKAKLIGKKYV